MDKSDYKVCTECGQEKHVSEFSKSYPHRCKACVAEHTRMVRERAKQEQNRAENTESRTEMQKVVVKDTGETVMVRPCREPLNARLAFYETEDGRKFPMFALEFSKEIDWEQRRYEIAKEAIIGVALNVDRFTRIEIETTVNNALELADLLIVELKKLKATH
jgi:hypothetical protein|nr:MAG TPA: restriction endonuclease [Caudoviricetes sp.]